MQVITPEMLSPTAKEYLESNNQKFTPQSRLTQNLYDKCKCKIHIKNLQLYMSLGMKLTKIHRALEFQQSAWVKPYIDFCTKMRQEATNEEEKDFAKLYINCIFGKLVSIFVF